MPDWERSHVYPSTVPQHFQNSVMVMPDIDISLNGILKLLLNLKPGKAAGPDNLRPALLKELREEIAPILQVIFTRFLETGRLPADWCRANVILCKVLEHIMASNLVKHFDGWGSNTIYSMDSVKGDPVRHSSLCYLRILQGEQVWVNKRISYF